MRNITALSFGLLVLSACGQQDAAHPTMTLPNYEQHKAALPTERAAQPAPDTTSGITLSRADGQLTSLNDSLPEGALSAQAPDKSVPIILVHGLGGWGKGEMFGLNYWGWNNDIAADLKAQGYTVYTASVGPVSSNWDRAAELYAQIKGGCVDYGKAAAQQHGHDRFDQAKCYPGFYPEWDEHHPVNLVGHSMGGTTSRMLVSLLEQGHPADAEAGNLYTGGREGWVKSVMTISTPNTGSPAADQLTSAIPLLKDTIFTLAGLTGLPQQNLIYDMKLGQWGVRRGEGESVSQYLNRVFDPKAPLWKSNDNAAYDLSVEGQHQANLWMGRSQHTRYFSWASSDTYAGGTHGWHYPNPEMSPGLMVTAFPYGWPLPNGLGNISGHSPNGTYKYGPQWWENDGLVPVYVQHAPLNERSVAYTGQRTQPGEWYRLGQMNGYDHTDIIGVMTPLDVKQFYRDQAAFLSSQ